jgi:methylated-DNA-[protein]-cysteine S-methyltransferase
MSQCSPFTTHYYKSPLGWIEIIENEVGLASLQFVTSASLLKENDNEFSSTIKEDLDRYFKKGQLKPSVKLTPSGTPFQKKIWGILKEIPNGKTKTYKDVALAHGDLKSIRAIATAIGKNPILLFIPCHRVIGSDGSMTGYAGGIERKNRLLALEGMSIQKTLDL